MWLRHINELLSTISYFSQHVIPLNDCSRQTCTLRYVQFQINQKSLEFWNSLWFIESHQTINALTFSWIPLFFSNLYLWIVSTQISSSTFVRCKQILDWMRKTYFTIIFGCFFLFQCKILDPKILPYIRYDCYIHYLPICPFIQQPPLWLSKLEDETNILLCGFGLRAIFDEKSRLNVFHVFFW